MTIGKVSIVRGSPIYPPSQKTTSLLVVECVIDRLLRRDVAHYLGG